MLTDSLSLFLSLNVDAYCWDNLGTLTLGMRKISKVQLLGNLQLEKFEVKSKNKEVGNLCPKNQTVMFNLMIKMYV